MLVALTHAVSDLGRALRAGVVAYRIPPELRTVDALALASRGLPIAPGPARSLRRRLGDALWSMWGAWKFRHAARALRGPWAPPRCRGCIADPLPGHLTAADRAAIADRAAALGLRDADDHGAIAPR